MQTGRRREAEVPGKRGLGQIALEQRHAPPFRRRRGRKAHGDRRAGRPGRADGAGALERARQARVRLERRRGPGPPGANRHPAARGLSARTGSLARRRSSHPLGRGDAEQARARPAIVRLAKQGESEPRSLDPLALGPDHLAIAVEAVEVGGDRGRVGADPVRGAPGGRLAHLLGKLEQALDQLALGRVEGGAGGRRSRAGGDLLRAPARPCAGCWRCGRGRTGRSRPGSRWTGAAPARGRGRRWCRGCARA